MTSEKRQIGAELSYNQILQIIKIQHCCTKYYRRLVYGAIGFFSILPRSAPFVLVCEIKVVLATVTVGADWWFTTLPRVVINCAVSFRDRWLAMIFCAISRSTLSTSTWPNMFPGFKSRSPLRNSDLLPQSSKCISWQAFYLFKSIYSKPSHLYLALFTFYGDFFLS